MTDRACLAPGPDGGACHGDDLAVLLQATAQGDHDAFNLVYEQLYDQVYSMIRAVLRDCSQSEEVAQEVLLEIWQIAFRYDPGKGGAIAWVLTIARRRAIDRVRSAAAAAGRERRTAVVSYQDQVSELVEDILECDQLRRCLGRLSTLQREAIVLAFYDGHTYLQVADMLQVPLGTVKARIRDGLNKLRAGMQSGAVPRPGRRARTA